VLSLLFIGACQDRCAEDVQGFWKEYIQLMDVISSKKITSHDRHWELLDLQFKRYLNDCYPKYSSQLATSQQDSFWKLNIGYLYNRYELTFLKKFRKTDATILKIKDSLFIRKIDIASTIDSLQLDWPCFQKMDNNDKDKLRKYLQRKTQDTLLPKKIHR